MSNVRIRLSVRLTGWSGGSRAGWLVGLLAGVLVAVLALAWLGRGSAEVSAAPGPLNPLNPDSPPYFYITQDNYRGNQALEACSEGYHLASLWELQEATRLVYAVDHPQAKVREDSGQGPPAMWYGWVRTGGEASTLNAPGQANCAAWTDGDGGTYGTIARLTGNWTAAGEAISPWDPSTWACGGLAPAWCVSDQVYDGFLPVLGNGE